jgi:phenylpyruvate tautomerase PptA (4-oxalocrotonate tautomerase family)/heme-degrading monooxygenase HmoA
MPVVHIHLEPRDEQSKARIAREVAAAVAEGTNNPVSGVTVVIHDLPASQWSIGIDYAPFLRARREATGETARPSGSGIPEFATLHVGDIADEAAYVKLRNEVVNPALAEQEGFVSATLYRLREPANGYITVNKWLSEDHWKAWNKTEVDRTTTQAQLELLKLWDAKPFNPHVDIVHQRFGAHGGERL